jgi:hypothetical protein
MGIHYTYINKISGNVQNRSKILGRDTLEMIDFRPIQISDKEWMDEIFFNSGFKGAEYNFTNCYNWGRIFGIRVARYENFIFIKLKGRRSGGYLFPPGSGDLEKALNLLKSDASECGNKFVLLGLTRQTMAKLEEILPGRFIFEEDRPVFDYLYNIDKLAELKGKKLHAKRNHINRFIEENPDWSFEPITVENLAECIEMHHKWREQYLNKEGDITIDEGTAIKSAFDNFWDLKLEGGLLRTNGRVVAFTIGDRINQETYDVHFEEAFHDIRGAYTMINREFSRYVRSKYPDIKYMNREDDLGLVGLRKAKSSYYPDLMVEKYVATFKD